MAANQEATRNWWAVARPRFDLFISEIVAQEASGGDPEAARRGVTAIEGLPELDVSEEAELLATSLLAEAAIPEKAKTDALHCTSLSLQFLALTICSLGIANTSQTP